MRGGLDGLPLWFRQWRICLQCRRPRFNHWVSKSPWRREWQPTPVFLPGELHGQRSLEDYSPWGHKESDTTEQDNLSLVYKLPDQMKQRILLMECWSYHSETLDPELAAVTGRTLNCLSWSGDKCVLYERCAWIFEGRLWERWFMTNICVTLPYCRNVVGICLPSFFYISVEHLNSYHHWNVSDWILTVMISNRYSFLDG